MKIRIDWDRPILVYEGVLVVVVWVVVAVVLIRAGWETALAAAVGTAAGSATAVCLGATMRPRSGDGGE